MNTIPIERDDFFLSGLVPNSPDHSSHHEWAPIRDTGAALSLMRMVLSEATMTRVAFGGLAKVADSSGNDVTAAPPVNVGITFAGREFDSETGLYYNRARYYSPGTGRFLQADPAAGSLNTPISFINKYAYAGNIPIIYRDPSGAIFGIDDVIVAFIIIGAVQGFMAGQKAGLSGWSLVGSTVLGAAAGAAGPAGEEAFGVAGGLLAATAAGAAEQAGLQELAFGKIVNTSNIWVGAGSGFVGGTLGYEVGGLGYGYGLTIGASKALSETIGLGLGALSGPLTVATPSQQGVQNYNMYIQSGGNPYDYQY